jgi:hypothetical protein
VAFVYYVFATQLFKLFNPEESEDEFKPVKRKGVSLVCPEFDGDCADKQTPGMGMTYIYEPVGKGIVQPTGQMPTKAPTHRLTTSLDSRFAS